MFNMKKLQQSLLLLLFVAAAVASCGRKESGQLVGVISRPKWSGVNPYGMVYVPSGSLHIGSGDEDLSKSLVARPKTISIQGFFMDDTEITNRASTVKRDQPPCEDCVQGLLASSRQVGRH